MLETTRLIMRRWKESDAESLFEYAKDPSVGPVAGWPPHKSVAESLSVIQNIFNRTECYAICEKGSDKAIGAIELKLKGFTDMTDRDDECELGYWLGKPFWGRAYMPEAVRELLRYGFESLGMKTIWCGYYDGNENSKRVQEKVGFVYHHTCNEVPVPLLNEIRIGHTNYMTREQWQAKRRYKIIASDLDGTMLDDDSHLSETNYQAVKKLTEMGVLVVPSSGRTFCDLPQEIKENPFFRYIVHSNGAVIIDKKTGKRYLECIPENVSKEMFEIVNRYDVHITVRHNGSCLVDKNKQSSEAYDFYNVQKGHGELVNLYADFSENFEAECYSLKNIEQLSVFFHSNEERTKCKQELLKFGELLVAEAYDHNLEICYVKAGKGNAIKKLAEITGVSIEETIAVGDSDNDVTAVSIAGLGLAVENSCAELLAVADEKICSNTDNAIEFILKNYY